MPDTTLRLRRLPHRGPASEEYDDAAGYYVAGDPIADTKAPGGPLEERWGTRKFEARIANPANRRRLSIIVVGTGLAGASAAATLGEAGYVVKSFCYQDSPAPRALDRRPGRHQRGQELQGRRRLRLPALLRHHQGRRLPLAASPTSTGWPRSA